MTQENPTITFAKVAAGNPPHWRRPRSFEFVRAIPHVPLADTEVLQTSLYLPVVIDYAPDGPRVVAATNPRFHRWPMTGSGGKWLRTYLPICLRCLPFRTVRDADGNTGIEVAIDLGEKDQPALPTFSANGALTPEVQKIAALLRRLEEGKQALQKAAEMLLIADVLTSLRLANIPDAAPANRYLTVDRNKFASLSNSRVAHIIRDGFLPIDLAAACIASQRLMPTLVSVATADQTGAGHSKAISTRIDDLVSTLTLNVEVDPSELFSFEQFKEMSG